MQVDDAPDDDVARETYNFPPGSFGLVYRADVPDSGLRDDDAPPTNSQADDETNADANTNDHTDTRNNDSANAPPSSDPPKPISYHLKAMKWGLIPFWTKRSPDYSSMLRTINCRDDSLPTPTGLWNTMKQRKRCLVIAQGFYEWLKKGPNSKVPHFVKRADGQLMLMAGLWDCVKYEDAEEKLYTYTVITTEANKQLRFLHDRMPVILNPGSEELKMWLDPRRNKWSSELQQILKPYEGALECYPVSQEVGKVGNNSATFIVPVDSKENKKNIANFFDNAKKQSPVKKKAELDHTGDKEDGITKDQNSTETHAPMPEPPKDEDGKKRKLGMGDEAHEHEHASPPSKAVKTEQASPMKSTAKTEQNTPSKPQATSPEMSAKQPAKKSKSATSNQGNTLNKKASPMKSAAAGSQRITSFFGKTDPG